MTALVLNCLGLVTNKEQGRGFCSFVLSVFGTLTTIGGTACRLNTKNSAVDLKEIKAIIDLMKKNSLAEFELEEKDFKIKLKRPIGLVAPLSGFLEEQESNLYRQVGNHSAGVSPQLPIPANSDAEIKSPMIGTLYRAPSPDAAPYVDIGAEVGPETVVCIIEAMKVMNEIKAEQRGIITAILADNTKPVEFGQPLFRIRPT